MNFSDAQKQWSVLFKSNDPFVNPYEEVFDYTILYPTNGYHLSKNQFDSVCAISKSFGESGFWVAVVEYEKGILEPDTSWWFTSKNYSKYLELPLVLETSIFSSIGKWGVIISHEGHGLFGAIGETTTNFMSSVGNTSDVEKFRTAYKDFDWAESLSLGAKLSS